MNFVAIDFETANEKRSSPCAIGIAAFIDGKCVESFSRLIRPPDCRFNPFNTAIHGISENDVKDQPEFCDIWRDLRSFFEGNLIIAHNASFDMSVLRHTLDHYDIPYPRLTYNCTILIAKQVWPNLITYNLAFVANLLNISLCHHVAVEDALACAKVARRACNECNVSTMQELEEYLEIEHGELFFDGYRPPAAHRNQTIQSHYRKKVNPSDLTPSGTNIDEDNPFYGRHVVFTGTLRSLIREKAMQLVVDHGGKCGNSVTKTTNYLVVGDFDLQKLQGEKKSGKLRQAESFVQAGRPIEILSENDFLKMLSS
jgi:DNA polymerase-3 subunit epsilon